jgi:putative alpha-1,2-mannosidase
VKGGTETGVSPNAAYVERQELADYLRLGWVPHDGTEGSSGATTTMFGDTAGVWASASTTLEYGVADFAVARVAAAAGDRTTYRTFMQRSGGWRHLYNPASGYLEPRYASGAFKPGLDLLGGEGFAEGDAPQYTWMVPFDPAGLFAQLGAGGQRPKRLDQHLAKLNDGPRSANAFLGNEPQLGVPWLYDWLGQPWKTQRVVRQASSRCSTTRRPDTPATTTSGRCRRGTCSVRSACTRRCRAATSSRSPARSSRMP